MAFSTVITDFFAFLGTTQVNRVAAALFVVLMGVGMGVGFSVASSNARNDSDADYTRRLAIFSQWQMDLTSQFTKATAVADTLGAFVLSSVSEPANMSAPAAQRMKYVNPDAFQRLIGQVFTSGITAIFLAPGFVLTQIYPPTAATHGLDLMTRPTYSYLFPMLSTTSGLITTGPNRLASRPQYACFVWRPVHVSNITSLATFWGVAYVLIEIPTLLASLNITAIMKAQRMEYAMWYTTTANGTAPTVIAESNPTLTPTVIAQGMPMKLPIAEAGRESFLAMYPTDGPVSPNMSTSVIVAIVVATTLGSALIAGLVFVFAFAHFLYRHRRAPANRSTMYVGAFALRGAQPIADKAPLVAVRMFNEFSASVRQLAITHGCYPVCEIGDRCVYIVSEDPSRILKMAQAAVLGITVRGELQPQLAHQNHGRTRASLMPNNRPRSTSVSYSTAYGNNKTAISHVSEELTQSSFISSMACHPSVACHVVTANRVYDPLHDVYFYGTSQQLDQLCQGVDMAKSGEVCWTVPFQNHCNDLCKEVSNAALNSNTVSENEEVVLHVACWWKDADERENEDPSMAMAVLSDAYVRRMAVLVSEGKAEAKERKRKGELAGEETRSGSTDKGEDATFLTRMATMLHVAVLSDGDQKEMLNIIRRIVSEEKGSVVSAHDNIIVAAFNLMSAGGHHEVRAADTVTRIQEALPYKQIACSIHHGKVGALVASGLVMCTGPSVAQGKALLQAAIEKSSQTYANFSPQVVKYKSVDFDANATSLSGSQNAALLVSKKLPMTNTGGGSMLCLLCCNSELSSAYDCEAVDIATIGEGAPKIVYRLAHRKIVAGKLTDDEWMYRMKDEEDHSPFAVVNAVFGRIVAHDMDGAARLWRDFESSGACTTFEHSKFSTDAIRKYLKVGPSN